MVLADTVLGIAPDGDHRLVTTSRGRLRARAVILATGVDWRRLEVPSLEAFFGVGVFYGAAVSEADAMTGRQVVVVGGGNSAGQAAIHLNKRAGGVTVAVRGPSLAETMSDYLIREIDASPTITLRHNTEVVDATGRGRLERLILRDNRTGSTETLAADALFVMIAAEPRTDWLGEVVARDTAGYLLTGPDVPAAAWPLDRPPLFLETSLPGVFAVGDVQHGSTKRVATSVGSARWRSVWFTSTWRRRRTVRRKRRAGEPRRRDKGAPIRPKDGALMAARTIRAEARTTAANGTSGLPAA
jgi:thioredoxin reductase (NADPH)